MKVSPRFGIFFDKEFFENLSAKTGASTVKNISRKGITSWWRKMGKWGKFGTIAAITGGIAMGALALRSRAAYRRRIQRAQRFNPGFKRAHGMPIDGGIGATGDLTLALRSARHR